MTNRNNIVLKYTSPYNPQSNPIERVMRELGRLLRVFIHNKLKEWPKAINKIEEVINSTVHESTGLCPYQFHDGEKDKLILSNRIRPVNEKKRSKKELVKLAQQQLEKSLIKRITQNAKKSHAEEYKVGQKCWVRM